MCTEQAVCIGLSHRPAKQPLPPACTTNNPNATHHMHDVPRYAKARKLADKSRASVSSRRPQMKPGCHLS